MSKKQQAEVEYDYDSDQELELLEQELLGVFDDDDIEYPSESEIMMTIQAIKPYVPVKENKWKSHVGNMTFILKQSLQELFMMSNLFWISNSLLILVGLAGVLLSERNPYLILLFLAPLPTITGLWEVLTRMNSGMAELELSLKYNLQQIILSKMVVIGGFNLLVNVFFTCISFLYHDLLIWKLLLYWITPYTVITAISFVVVSRFRKAYTITSGLAIWLVFGSLASRTNLMGKIESLPLAMYVVLINLSLIVSVWQITKIYKRGVRYEFNR